MADTRLYELEECVSPQADDILLIEESATQTDKKVKVSSLMPTDAVESAVADWLTAHPEATTTVEDGSITPVKLATSTMDLFDAKANTAGEYDDMTVGSAKQLLSKGYTENKTPYIYRASAGGDRVYEKLIGGTIAWNQLVQNADTSCTIPILRKYIARIGDTWSIGISDGTAITVDGSIRDMVFDLTQMLGSTIADYIYSLEQSTAGAGVAYFHQMFPNDYYAYDTGSLQSVNVASKKVVGFNQWDEVWELGSISTLTGENTNGTTMFRSKNLIPIIPNTLYYIKLPNSGAHLYYYDKKGDFISHTSQAANSTFTTPNNAYYLRFVPYTNYNLPYNNDVCINISNASKNGTYAPYEEHTYAFDSDLTLRGIPKLDASNNLYYDGDVYESDGTVTRKYGIVDLGSLTWLPNSAQTGRFDSDSLTSLKAVGETNILCALYTTTTSSRMPSQNMVIRGSTVNSNIVIVNTAFAGYTNTQVQNALSGVYLVYELATPTTESADAYINPQIVDADGTEEFVDYGVEQETRDVAVPVGHESKYMINLRAKIEDAVMLPTLPTANGTYTLKCTVASGVPTLSWVAD